MKAIIKNLECQITKLDKEAAKSYEIYLKYKSSRSNYTKAAEAYEIFESIERSISKLKDALSSIKNIKHN